jgi:DNA-3-methyladenine glycosylase
MPKKFWQRSRQPVAKTCTSAAIVPRDVYLDPPDLVAQKLLGKLLVRGAKVGRVVEVEAYFGESDPASHSFPGKTPRNAVLFGPPGHAYVYFIYGMHYCLNVSCEPDGRPGGVLFRALEPICGLKLSTSGPGRLCKAFGITRSRDNGVDFTSPSSNLQIQDDGYRANDILVTPRIGITKDAHRPARFLLAGNPFVSKGPLARATNYQ